MKKLFEEIPHCEGDRVTLKKVSMADADALKRMVQNENVYCYLPATLYERSNDDVHYIIDNLYTEAFRDSIIMGIYVLGDFCGLAEFYAYNDALHKVSVGYRLLEEYWYKGIATEALGLMIDYLENETDIEIITASTMVDNQASANVLMKNGFVLVNSFVNEDWGYPEPTLTDKWLR